MTSNPYADVPAAPPGIAEWEELLIRFELGPRIAATALEEIPTDRWSSPGNSGAVQRRGVEVWAWAAPHREWGRVTVYQLLSAAVRHDGHHIRRIREAC